VSWGEFVETKLLADFRERGAPLQSLRPAVQRLRQELSTPYPLATAEPYLELHGKELVARIQEASGVAPTVRLIVLRSGQFVLTPTVARFVDMAHFEGGFIRSLKTDSETPEVAIDPLRARGRPAIRSVPTEVLAEGFRAGEALGELAGLYELSVEQVLQAIRFEMRAQRERESAA